MWTSMIVTLCIILVVLHHSISLRCFECLDGDESAVSCFRPFLQKEQLFPSNQANRLSSCDQQASVFCSGSCASLSLSGCGYTDLRKYILCIIHAKFHKRLVKWFNRCKTRFHFKLDIFRNASLLPK